MSRYRRSHTPGATYFFTVTTYRRQTILCDETIRAALRNAIADIRIKRPFTIDAWVLLPDHMHCIWTLPEGDADYAMRWSMIKRQVSVTCDREYLRLQWLNPSKRNRRESTIWQRRYWEHQIRNNEDFARHMDYVHYNPVKHGYCKQAAAWPYSSFHRYVTQGVYALDWGSDMQQIIEIRTGE